MKLVVLIRTFVTYQIHIRRSEHALVEHGHDAGGDDVSGAADEAREDVERVELGRKVMLPCRVTLRHCGKLKRALALVKFSGLGSISPTFYAQLLRSQIPKAQ